MDCGHTRMRPHITASLLLRMMIHMARMAVTTMETSQPMAHPTSATAPPPPLPPSSEFVSNRKPMKNAAARLMSINDAIRFMFESYATRYSS